MFRAGAAFLVALVCLVMPAHAADEPASQWKYENPFCQVVALVAPMPDVVASVVSVASETRYLLELYASQGTTLGAHVTLVSHTAAYDAAVPETGLVGPPQDRKSEAFVVALPAPDRLEYFFVDSYVLDRGGDTSCPSYVLPVGETAEASPGASAIQARYLQKIGSLKCGQEYVPPSLHGDLESPVGRYGGRPLVVVARAYIDSNGYSIKEEIVKSSGVEGMDQYMLGAIGVHRFGPAQFLCVPVVGITEIELRYFP